MSSNENQNEIIVICLANLSFSHNHSSPKHAFDLYGKICIQLTFYFPCNINNRFEGGT